jgi:putative phosphoribosyl transferase
MSQDDPVTRAQPPRGAGAVDSIAALPFRPRDGDVRFADRRDAGRRLAALLGDLRNERPVVVGIPRGGVPVAAEVARALGAPLDLVLVRKIGAPGNPEYGIGALAEGDVFVIDEESVRRLRLNPAELDAAVERARRELAERSASSYARHQRLAVAGRTVLLVDDGLATGHSAQAAAYSLRERGATRVIMAIPVAARAPVRAARAWVDEVVCVQTPADLWAIGLWYEDFSPTSDEEVAALLTEHAGPPAGC